MTLVAAHQGTVVATDAVLDALEAEAVWCMRETAGAFRRPVWLYSIGKDSSVLLHLARKAFVPAPVPFPLSNWTEIDVWRYIRREQIPVLSLYFARKRRVVERDGLLLMRDDERMPLLPGEQDVVRKVRFRTLGCFPVTAAVESEAETIDVLIAELEANVVSERAGRMIDGDTRDSMEEKKRAGYF